MELSRLEKAGSDPRTEEYSKFPNNVLVGNVNRIRPRLVVSFDVYPTAAVLAGLMKSHKSNIRANRTEQRLAGSLNMLRAVSPARFG